MRLSIHAIHSIESSVRRDLTTLSNILVLYRMSVEVLLKCVAPTIGEGPHWDDKTQTLLFADLLSHSVYKWDSNTGNLESRALGSYEVEREAP